MKLRWEEYSLVPEVRWLQREKPPGFCIFCDVELATGKRGRPAFMCPSGRCIQKYNTMYQRWRRKERVLAGLNQRGEPRERAATAVVKPGQEAGNERRGGQAQGGARQEVRRRKPNAR